MRDYLVAHLHGPLQAWGGIAVGEDRPSDQRPGKSAVVGMVAAALGITRDQPTRLLALQAALRMAIRIDHPGVSLTDYHTVMSTKARKGDLFPTREAAQTEATVNPGRASIQVTRRGYLCDAWFTLVLWSDQPTLLSEIQGAFRKPSFSLFLGRKSCPPALPIKPTLIRAATVSQALNQAKESEWIPNPVSPSLDLYWEGRQEEAQAVAKERRRDHLVDPLGHLFDEREEWVGHAKEDA